MAEKARARGVEVKRCRCSERQKGKPCGGRSLANTRWSGGRGCLRRGKWRGGERFVSVRGECAREEIGGQLMLRLTHKLVPVPILKYDIITSKHVCVRDGTTWCSRCKKLKTVHKGAPLCHCWTPTVGETLEVHRLVILSQVMKRKPQRVSGVPVLL